MKKFIILFYIIIILSQKIYANEDKKSFQIASGSVTGVYYPTAGALCRTINNNSPLLYCSVLVSEGSVSTIKFLRQHPQNLALSQSDVAKNAYHGTSSFEGDKRFRNIRKLFTIADENVTIIVRKDSKINNLSDLKGKIISFGSRGNGTESLINDIVTTCEWGKSSLKIKYINPTNLTKSLCKKEIDAIIYTVAHPNGLVREALNNCNSKILSLNNKDIIQLINSREYLKKNTINKNIYNTKNNINVVSVESALYTTASMPEEEIYDFTKQIFENLDSIRTLHPVLKRLKKPNMLNSESIIPLHPGAKKYFIEQGWITH